MAKDKKNIRKFYVLSGIALAVSVLILLTTLFFTEDIFVNRRYLAEKDFNDAFNSRLTGNCDGFMRYVAKDKENWAAKCVNEKALYTDPFYDFEIRKITVEGDRAFIQVKLVRGAAKSEYPVTYQMKLEDGRWMIDQDSTR